MRPEDLRNAVEEPEKKELIELPAKMKGMVIRLYLKSVSAKHPRFVLVVTNQQEGGSEMIADAWYVPKYLCPDEPTPLDVLAALCRNFGLRIRIAGLTERLIYSQTVTALPGQPANIQPQLVDKPPRQGVKVNAAIKENEDGSVDISLAYAIDVFALKRKLAG